MKLRSPRQHLGLVLVVGQVGCCAYFYPNRKVLQCYRKMSRLRLWQTWGEREGAPELRSNCGHGTWRVLAGGCSWLILEITLGHRGEGSPLGMLVPGCLKALWIKISLLYCAWKPRRSVPMLEDWSYVLLATPCHQKADSCVVHQLQPPDGFQGQLHLECTTVVQSWG